MFYVGNKNTNRKAASTDVIKKYASVFEKTTSGKGTEHFSDCRVIGVVTGKNAGTTPTIDVLFRGNADGKTIYISTKYVVNNGGVIHDDDETATASGLMDVSGKININIPKKSGGIDLEGRSGGIDLDIAPRSGGIDLG